MRTFLTASALALAASPLAATAEDRIVQVAGGPEAGAGVRLNGPFGVDFEGGAFTFVIVEMPGHRVRRIGGRRVGSSTIVGSGQAGFGGDGGPADRGVLNEPHAVEFGPGGDLFIADTGNRRVRKVDAKTRQISTFAGTGEKGFSGDGGPAARACFGAIYDLAFDAPGKTLYLADLDNRRVRAVDLATGVVTTAAGDGRKGVPADGAGAKSSPLVDPRAVAVDASANLYILERSGHALRVVGPDGAIRTVVGTGKAGAAGDDGPGRLATLNGPKHLCVEANGDVLIADTENHAVRRYRPRDGVIVRVAGTYAEGASGLGGPPGSAQLSRPHGVAVARGGVIHIADSGNNRILRIDHVGPNP